MHSDTLEKLLNNFEVAIFDLDGVIIDSGDIKVKCMQEALSDFEVPVVNSFLKEFKAKFGQPRPYHFGKFFHEYIKQDNGFDEFYKRYAGKYAQLLSERYFSSALCDHAKQLISWLASQQIKMFVATGTETSEAETILRKNKLDSYFMRVYGSPADKADSIDVILRETGVTKEKVVMIGDAFHDRNSAFKNQVSFIFVEKYASVNKEEMIENISGQMHVVKSLNTLDLVETVR